MAKKKILKFGLFQYWKPTPVFFRKIGDTCLGVSAFLATTEIISPAKTTAVLILGIAGKVFTNLFSHE